MMITLPAGTQIWIAAGITDLHRGFCRDYVCSRFVPTTFRPHAAELAASSHCSQCSHSACLSEDLLVIT